MLAVQRERFSAGGEAQVYRLDPSERAQTGADLVRVHNHVEGVHDPNQAVRHALRLKIAEGLLLGQIEVPEVLSAESVLRISRAPTFWERIRGISPRTGTHSVYSKEAVTGIPGHSDFAAHWSEYKRTGEPHKCPACDLHLQSHNQLELSERMAELIGGEAPRRGIYLNAARESDDPTDYCLGSGGRILVFEAEINPSDAMKWLKAHPETPNRERVASLVRLYKSPPSVIDFRDLRAA